MPNSAQNLQNLANSLEQDDSVDVLAHVDIDNKTVGDVLVVRTNQDGEQRQSDEVANPILAVVDESVDEPKPSKKRTLRQKLTNALGQTQTYLGELYQTVQTNPNKTYQPADLTAKTFNKHAFYEHGAKMGASVLGNRLVGVRRLASKVIAQEKFDKASQKAFEALANWANVWAKKELSKDVRFAKLNQLTDPERDDFARDIANKNKALAMAGGIAGVAGLKGVVVDGAWLLIVALKTIFSLAMIYDKPLTGKDGVALAYGVLSFADLDKLQEKQVLLMALAVGQNVASDADKEQGSLGQALKNLAGGYAGMDGFDELANYVNLDKLNLTWFRRLMPVVSVAVGVHYNKALIDEVIGTAMATFRPQRPPLLDEQKPSEQNAQNTAINDALDPKS